MLAENGLSKVNPYHVLFRVLVLSPLHPLRPLGSLRSTVIALSPKPRYPASVLFPARWRTRIAVSWMEFQCSRGSVLMRQAEMSRNTTCGHFEFETYQVTLEIQVPGCLFNGVLW